MAEAIKSGIFQFGGHIQMMTAVVPNKISIGKNGPMLMDGKRVLYMSYCLLGACFIFIPSLEQGFYYHYDGVKTRGTIIDIGSVPYPVVGSIP
jgi:hypothetical protein